MIPFTPSVYGLCPICTEALELIRARLVCPAGDYRVDAKEFGERWEKFREDIKEYQEKKIPLPKELTDQLLRDLQEMNIKERA